jgi:hypothetical protein
MSPLSLLLVLVSQDIPICTAPDNQYFPVTVAANDQYYVFWEDRRFVSVDTSYAIFGGRVSSDGTVLDPDGKRIFRSQARYDLSVATDGLGLFVAFEDSC